jgi:chaperonin GroES
VAPAKPQKKGGKPAAKAAGRPVSAPRKPAAKSPAPRPESKAQPPARPAAARSGSMNVRPLRDRVLVRRLEESEQKIGGIIVPDTAKEKPQRAEVVAVGSGRILENGDRIALTVKAGDRVLVGKWSGTDVKIDGTEYLIIKEDEILGIEG